MVGDFSSVILRHNEDRPSSASPPPEIQGTLSKWTNYIHGWQDRYVSLRSDGSLQYFKSERETDYGCRGAISIGRASIIPHEFDEHRFDVSVDSDCVWYLRTRTIHDRVKWIEVLEAYKSRPQVEEGISSSSSLSRGNSSSILPSETHLKDKWSEIRTFKDILIKQLNSLRSTFQSESSLKSSDHVQSELTSFEATTTGIVTALGQMMELIEQRESFWKKQLNEEVERRIKAENELIHAKEVKKIVDSHVNFEESAKLGYEAAPNSGLGEDVFYDAVEDALEKLQEEQTYVEKLRLMSVKPSISNAEDHENHPLWSSVENITNEQLRLARIPVGDVWELFAEDGEMKMYKREEEVDGLVVDPLKAVHHVKGVTARELCHYFFSPEFRQEWEATVEQATVLERISDDALIFLQLHKRIWPAAQRDSLFWSHRRKIKDISEDGESDTWLVCNQSTKHPDAPENSTGSCLRIYLTVIFLCDTLIYNGKTVKNCTREDVSCKITYCSVVNPGGWVPATALRTVYKREYPKFLKRFTAYVIQKTKKNPIMW
ncbi:ceramide transfer protein [Lepeophtheirus salmonis]|uniref:Ceramide transfer protein n=1 Tax=Lepeophtheirus salmonis TaxID=72036 RepID=A0A0K2TBL2_LEPSM|nr:ceramide transfer protein-like [Lepeophtheirus salmonis]